MEHFFNAVRQGDEEDVSRQLDGDPTLLEHLDTLGRLTPLAGAATAGQLGVVMLLVQRGANIHARMSYDRTALHWAAAAGRAEIVVFLLSKGARGDTRGSGGSTPLSDAFLYGRVGVMHVLFQHLGPQVLGERIRWGWTALMEAAAGGQLDVVQVCLQDMRGQAWGQGLEERDREGRTALHWAVYGGHEEMVAFVLSKGAQANVLDQEDRTPLILACREGHLGMARMLTQRMGVQELDARDGDGYTALRWAAQTGHEEIVALLLNQGADAATRDTFDITPLCQARMEGHVGVVKVLLHHLGQQALEEREMAGRTALQGAAEQGQEEMAALLLSHGAQPNSRDFDACTPLIRAAERGHLGVVQMLLPHVGIRGLELRDVERRTALHYASRGGHAGVIRVLLLAGADHTVTDSEGMTPRAIVEQNETLACVEVFQWWEGELERRYLLQRARSLHDASTVRRNTPAAPVPAFLQARVAVGHELPQVEVVTGQQEEQHGGASSQTKASEEADSTRAEETESHASAVYVVTQLNEQLFTELMQGFIVPRVDSGAMSDDGSEEYDEAYDEDDWWDEDDEDDWEEEEDDDEES